MCWMLLGFRISKSTHRSVLCSLHVSPARRRGFFFCAVVLLTFRSFSLLHTFLRPQTTAHHFITQYLLLSLLIFHSRVWRRRATGAPRALLRAASCDRSVNSTVGIVFFNSELWFIYTLSLSFSVVDSRGYIFICYSSRLSCIFVCWKHTWI